MTENFPNLVNEKVTEVQEAQSAIQLDPKKHTPRHKISKMTRLKDKERIQKATRGKQVVTYKGAPIRLSSDYSSETFQAKSDRQEMFKVMKRKNLNQGYFTQQGYHLKLKEK